MVSGTRKKFSKEHKRKLSEIAKNRAGKKHPMYGKKHSDETKEKISKTLKGKMIGEKNPFYGKKHSDETKEKISKTKRKNNKILYYYSIPLYDTYAHQISYAEKVRRNEQDQRILEVSCVYCGKWFIPKKIEVYNRAKALNGKTYSNAENRLYCSDNCKKECPIFNRSKYSAEEDNSKRYSREVQPELRQLVFKRDNYICQKCEKHQDELECGLNCHHFEGVEINPIESADIDNCITLCKICHRFVHKKPCPLRDYRRKKCEEI